MDESGSSGEVKWTLSFSAELPKMDAAPKYSRISEHFRHVTPGVIQCSMFCGGKQCKYENPSRMKTDEMAINGLYSSWVTPQILATARPSTEVIKTYDVIQQFTSTGIRSLINLQHPGEHASCGFGLEPESGFSYVPEHFMQEDIYFYNFGWNDYGVRSLESILDMVKVMSFALTKGKAAVHCHAGLGRTGVLIACYLVFSERAEAEEAIHRVRSNRPKAVQTRGQIQCVIDFTNFLHHLWVVFPSCAPGAKMFTLQQYLKRQRHLLHGLESRHLKHIPKVVYLCCCRLLEVAGVKRKNTPLTMTLFREVKAVFAEADDNDVTNEPTGNSIQPSIAEDIVKALRHNPYVDSSVSSLDTAIIQHTQSWETVEGQNVELRGENQLEIGLLKPTNSTVHGRRASDFQVSYSGDTRSSDHKLILPLGHKEKLEPMNPANREPDKKKKGKGKNRRRMDAESSFANTVDKRVAENSFCNSLKQNAAQSATNERIQVAKCLASSACADSGVHNRVERIKRKLNSSDCWEEVHSESDPWILTRLLWNWLAELAEPALTEKEVSLLEESIDDPIRAVKQLGRGERETLECLITTICELEPLPKELSDRVLRHTAMILTHNMDLSLTQTRKQTDRVCTPSQSPRQSTADGGREFAEPSDSVLCSSSYRLVCFLRLLVEALKRLGGLS